MKDIYISKNLSYKIKNNYILNDINCSVKNKAITVIKGHNGAGKTSFLRLLYGLEKATAGYVHRNFDQNTTKISYLFQNSVFLNRSVKENLLHLLMCKKVTKHKWRDIIKNALEKFNLNHLYNLNINSLSGGELQLLAIIRSILIEPDVLFLDEPTNNLDKNNIDLVSDMILKLNNKGCTIIIASHDGLLLDKIIYNEINIEKGFLTHV